MEFAAKAHGCQNKAQLTDQLHLQTCENSAQSGKVRESWMKLLWCCSFKT
jgi:demethoxyubiquinone hydroxylase (CLK1/Coq7/Cat5 family)